MQQESNENNYSPSREELIKEVKQLEMVARKNVYSLLAGEYPTALPGKGMMFREARKYVFGESIRMIDWNMTARMQEAYVKVFQEEREREVYIALDISSSMQFGTQALTKIEFALELAATLAVSTQMTQDKLGYILFSDSAKKVSDPRKGKVQLFRALSDMILFSENRERSPLSDIRSVLHEIQKKKGRRFIIFIISDFMDRDIPDDLKYVKAFHDVNFLHVYDPLEYVENSPLFYPANSPEGDSNFVIIKPGSSFSSMEKYLKDACIKYRVSLGSFITSGHVREPLLNFFKHKKAMHLL